MRLVLLSVLIGVLVVLMYGLLEDLYLKKWMKRIGLRQFFAYLRGIQNDTRKSLFKKKYRDDAGKTMFLYTGIIASVLLLFALLIFKSIVFAILISSFSIMYPRVYKENKRKRKTLLLNLQLKDALNSIATSLKAGLSINSALVKSVYDLERVYVGVVEKPMLEELERVKTDLELGLSVDNALFNFSKRVKIDDVDDFVNSVIIVRQKGGNLVDVVVNVTEIINSKISIKREISRLTAGKRMESRIITFLPIIMIVLLSLLSPSYMQPLISTTEGRLLVFTGFTLLIINYFIGKKIVDIKV